MIKNQARLNCGRSQPAWKLPVHKGGLCQVKPCCCCFAKSKLVVVVPGETCYCCCCARPKLVIFCCCARSKLLLSLVKLLLKIRVGVQNSSHRKCPAFWGAPHPPTPREAPPHCRDCRRPQETFLPKQAKTTDFWPFVSPKLLSD